MESMEPSPEAQHATLKPSSSHQTHNTTQTSFLSLPREIRDTIYELALISSSPIVIWKGKWKVDRTHIPTPENPKHYHRNIDRQAALTSLRHLTWKLFFCNRIIGHEATSIFYRKNTFCFFGDHNWDPIVSWLNCIGAENRRSLKRLEIGVPKIIVVEQDADGGRNRCFRAEVTEDVYPRHPYLQLSSPVRPGLVDNINPAIENIFLLLGNRSVVDPLSLTLILPHGLCPGTDLVPVIGYPYSWKLSMDLPNLLERFRELHCENEEWGSAVDVSWKGVVEPRFLMGKVEMIRELGWDIEVVKDVDRSQVPYNSMGVWDPRTRLGVCVFLLRRRRIVGSLIAWEPYPRRRR